MSDQVAALLAQSTTAHKAAMDLRRKQRLAEATVTLTKARDLRVEAHALDPDHTAPAWTEEDALTSRGRDTHTDLMAFYARHLT